ncbi:MAG: LPS export ABC transporter periplasmic protein LptC [Myxococcales bacterium]|nr:LPS export ABC transporter periplasmic protein LptC [Myxococcales bacterium]
MTPKGMELASLARVRKLQRLRQGKRRIRAELATPTGRRPQWTLGAGSFVSIVLLALALAAATSADPTPSLDVEGMTFVASREDGDAVILHAEHARFDTKAKKAYLLVVDATIPSKSEQSGFTMRCDSGVVDLESNDFEAIGNVKGQADSGEIFQTDWVRYDHANGILFTESPVLITDGGTTIRGGGFRYDVSERRFQMTGGAQVVQTVNDDTAKEENVP